MFEEKTYENILEEALGAAPKDIDTRQGSIYYNHVAPVAFMISRYYSEMQITIDLIFIDTAEGIYLDEKAKEHGIYRLPAQPNVRSVVFDGVVVSKGVRFFAESLYFKTVLDADDVIVVEAEKAGELPNHIPIGTNLVPVNAIYGLKSAVIGSSIFLGTEMESDENLRRRLREKINGPAENGNRQHYKTWCESVEGVGIARIDPLWNGANTVRGIIIGTDGLGGTEALVEEVQTYIDPMSQGLGNGVANIGAYFTAVRAEEHIISISFKVSLIGGRNLELVIEEIKISLIQQFKDLTLESREKNGVTIRSSSIANVIYDIEGVIDYADLNIDGGTANLFIPFTQVPKLGVLTIEPI